MTTEYAILDCIFEATSRTYYALDIMCWRGTMSSDFTVDTAGHPVYDSDYEFRSFWLLSKVFTIHLCQQFIHTAQFSEEPAIAERCKTNPYVFKMMPRFECSPEAIAEALETPQEFFIAGLTFFYHPVSQLGRAILSLQLSGLLFCRRGHAFGPVDYP